LAINALLDCPTVGDMAAPVMKTQGQMGLCEDLDRILKELETMSEDEGGNF
jgi:hypothetical protein